MKLLRNRAVRIVLDAGLLVGFLAEFLTREGPNYNLHSWIGVALIPAVAVHLATSWRWVTSAARRRTSHPEWPLARFNAAFAVVTAICVVSGFPLWFEWTTGGLLSGLHQVTGLLSIVLALSHLWRNRDRLSLLLGRRSLAT